MHDGLFGRNDVYSYISHEQTWWKIADHNVVEVRNLRLFSYIVPNDLVYAGPRRDGDNRHNRFSPECRTLHALVQSCDGR